LKFLLQEVLLDAQPDISHGGYNREPKRRRRVLKQLGRRARRMSAISVDADEDLVSLLSGVPT
jgi:hypothetical protein